MNKHCKWSLKDHPRRILEDSGALVLQALQTIEAASVKRLVNVLVVF